MGVYPNGGIAVDRQHLVSGPYIFGIGVAVGTHADNIAAVADHLRLPAVVVAVRTLRRNKKGVGVVQGIQRRRDLGKRQVHGLRLINLLLCFLDLRIPVHPVEFRIIVMLANVVGDIMQHI